MATIKALAVMAAVPFAFFSFVSPALAVDYDASKEFSNTQNPNGVWSYRGVSTGETNTSGSYLLNLNGSIGDSEYIGWILDDFGGNCPCIGNDLGNFPTFGMHPGENEDALFAYRSDATFGESADIAVSVYDGDTSGQGNGQLLSIWKNDNLLEGPIQLPPVFQDIEIEINDVRLVFGDYLFIRVSADEAGIDWGNDAIDLDMVVSVRPLLSPAQALPADVNAIPIFSPIGLLVLIVGLMVTGIRGTKLRQLPRSQKRWKRTS